MYIQLYICNGLVFLCTITIFLIQHLAEIKSSWSCVQWQANCSLHTKDILQHLIFFGSWPPLILKHLAPLFPAYQILTYSKELDAKLPNDDSTNWQHLLLVSDLANISKLTKLKYRQQIRNNHIKKKLCSLRWYTVELKFSTSIRALALAYT